ncbi:MAG TPA: hypothetical protein VKF36_00795, partial [Syntrophorhabdales bacterium]|nr:hypothetical protein [Syntrophorhabdales bacterium]
PKTPGTMLQNGYTDTNVNKVLTAGTYPWTILPAPYCFSKGCFHWTSPGAEAPGSDATNCECGLSFPLAPLRIESCNGSVFVQLKEGVSAGASLTYGF